MSRIPQELSDLHDQIFVNDGRLLRVGLEPGWVHIKTIDHTDATQDNPDISFGLSAMILRGRLADPLLSELYHYQEEPETLSVPTIERLNAKQQELHAQVPEVHDLEFVYFCGGKYTKDQLVGFLAKGKIPIATDPEWMMDDVIDHAGELMKAAKEPMDELVFFAQIAEQFREMGASYGASWLTTIVADAYRIMLLKEERRGYGTGHHVGNVMAYIYHQMQKQSGVQADLGNIARARFARQPYVRLEEIQAVSGVYAQDEATVGELVRHEEAVRASVLKKLDELSAAYVLRSAQ